jgi:sigma-B regulation protein RsbU (phosphoserine phosphatase)
MLMELVGALSRAVRPEDVLRTFAAGVSRVYGPMGYISLSTRGLGPGEYRITRQIRQPDADAMADTRALTDAAHLPVWRGGLLGEIIRSAYPELIHHLHAPGDPVLGDWLTGFGSLLAIPLFDEGEPRNWSIMLRPEPEAFSVNDLEEWILRANLVGGAVRNTLMSRQLHEAHAAIQREVESIAAIQRALLPSDMPAIHGLRLAASYATFDRAGGDYYDFLPVALQDNGAPDPSGPWGILIADASGHGPAAAVLMAMLHALVHALPADADRPAQVLRHVNEHLHAKRIESSFVTAFFGIYDPASRKMVYARAGHPPPLLMRHAGDGWSMTRLEDAGGLPLGVLEDAAFDEASVRLEPGQTVVFYTDGVTDAASPAGVPFAVGGIERSLTTCSGDPECVIDHVTEALRVHEAGVRPADDQTIVVMKLAEA